MTFDYEHYFTPEQIDYFKKEGQWPPKGVTFVTEVKAHDDEVVSFGKLLAKSAKLNGDPIIEAIGKTMEYHPKSWPAVLLSRTVSGKNKQIVDHIIKEIETDT